MLRRLLQWTLGACLASTWLISFTAAEGADSGWVVLKKNPSPFHGLAAVSPLPGNVEGIITNPALLGSVGQPELFSVFELGVGETAFGELLFAYPGDGFGLAGGLAYFDAGTMDLNWFEGTQLQTETVRAQQDISGFISYGMPLTRQLWSGITLKAVRSEIIQRQAALAVAGDAGLAYRILPDWMCSFAVRNVGLATPFVDVADPLPSSLYIGSGYYWQNPQWQLLTGAGAAYNWVEQTVYPEVGLSFHYSIMSINAGYQFNLPETNLHFGVGLVWNSFELRYAFRPGVHLQSTHGISLGYRFGEKTQAAPARRPAQRQPDVRARISAPPVAAQPAPVVRAPLQDQAVPDVQRVRLKKLKRTIQINWQKPSGVGRVGYNIYMKKGQGPFRKLNRQVWTKTQYVVGKLTRGQRYTFMIKTVDDSGRESRGTRPPVVRY